MTARPDHQQFADFGAPPVAPSGARRLWPLVKVLTTRTIFVAGALAIWQVAAPEAYKPAALFGGFAGAVMTAETNGAADAQVHLQRRMAELNVEMQMRVFRAQTLMQQELQNLAGEQAMTQIADVGCIGGMLVGAIAHAFDDRDWESGAGKVAQGACGVAQAVHVQLTQAQQAVMQGDLTMASAGFDGHDYSDDDAKALVRYFLTLPPGTRGALLAGLDVRNNAVDQNTFGDRILIQYPQTHHA